MRQQVKPHYRVSLFGSARVQEGDRKYQDFFAPGKTGTLLERNLFGTDDMHMLFYVTEPQQVVSLIKNIHTDRLQEEQVCKNFSKYRFEFHVLNQYSCNHFL
jgi:hypothetical protein